MASFAVLALSFATPHALDCGSAAGCDTIVARVTVLDAPSGIVTEAGFVNYSTKCRVEEEVRGHAGIDPRQPEIGVRYCQPANAWLPLLDRRKEYFIVARRVDLQPGVQRHPKEMSLWEVLEVVDTDFFTGKSVRRTPQDCDAVYDLIEPELIHHRMSDDVDPVVEWFSGIPKSSSLQRQVSHPALSPVLPGG